MISFGFSVGMLPHKKGGEQEQGQRKAVPETVYGGCSMRISIQRHLVHSIGERFVVFVAGAAHICTVDGLCVIGALFVLIAANLALDRVLVVVQLHGSGLRNMTGLLVDIYGDLRVMQRDRVSV